MLLAAASCLRVQRDVHNLTLATRAKPPDKRLEDFRNRPVLNM